MEKFITTIRALSLLTFGVVTTFFTTGGTFARLYSLKVLYFVPLWVIGGIAIVLGVALLLKRFIIFGYVGASIFTSILMMCAYISLFTYPMPTAPSIFFYPIIVSAFLAGAWRSVTTKYGSPTD